MAIMSIIRYDFIQGIPDKYGFQELKANSLGMQILSLHGYVTHKLNNFNPDFFPEVDFDLGIDEAIFRSRIPKDDPLQLRDLKSHFDDMTITIDYKSNNLNDKDSIYVKLKPYVHPNKYFEHTKNGKKINPVQKYLPESHSGKYYTNHQILGRMNKSDLMIYLKYDCHEEEFHLKQAYLIGKDILKEQVIYILNQVLGKVEYPQIKSNEESLRLNQKITEAYRTVQEDRTILNNDMELVKIQKHRHDTGDIMLRIPERYLQNYIKVNEDGEIIFSDITDFNSK